MKSKIVYAVILLAGLSGITIPGIAQQKLRVGLAGMNHDHVGVALEANKKGRIDIIGIAEPNRQLREGYQHRYGLPDSLFFDDLASLLKQRKPDVVMAYNPTSQHLSVVQACAPRGITVMVEKPLALNFTDAEKIAMLAKKYHTHVFTNYWTTWYASDRQIYKMTRKDSAIGPIRKLVFHDGHQGPKEIGVTKEFLQWLTDPMQNGGGAIMDFGCYGINQSTWMMDNQLPVAVTAVTRHIKPEVYPKVDDDATIILEYAGATAIIEASWNWPFTLLDMEVYGQKGYLQAIDNNHIREKRGNTAYTYIEASPTEKEYQDNISYLEAVLKGNFHPPDDQASLKNNLVVVKILDAARRSAREGKRITL